MKKVLMCFLLLLIPLSVFAASGDIIARDPAGEPGSWQHVKGLDAVVAVDNGVWIDASNYNQASIHVTGITTATIKINGSSAATKPAAGTHDIELASLTADGQVDTTVLPRWIKARASAWTAGTISVLIMLRR